MIDTHCHLYLKEFDTDLEAVLHRADAAGLKRFYLPAIDSSTHQAMIDLELRYPDKCFAMMGLHPCSVQTNYEEELNQVKQWLANRTFAAVGEIGLDFYWDRTYEKEQYTCFNTQMEWALQYQLPIVIHTRNAMQETINEVKALAKNGLTGIFHCFSGSYESASQILDMGFYLGIGGVVTYKNAGLAEVLKKVDISHLVLETDSPYLTPVPFRGKRNESSYLKYVVDKIAETKSMGRKEVIEATTNNAVRIFGSKTVVGST